MTRRIHCGTFEAEKYWRDASLASLPVITDQRANAIVSSMDEMLVVFCGENDVLLTRRALDEAHVQYLHLLGFRFSHNKVDLESMNENASDQSIVQLINTPSLEKHLAALLPSGASIEPFAILPGTRDAAVRYGLRAEIPDEAVVKQVNGKQYTLTMRDDVGISNIGCCVESAEQLKHTGNALLLNGSFLIKDDFGVSGKGNLTVDSPRLLNRLVDYLTVQERKGKQVRFILEPLLDRELDFSCQFYVGQQGDVMILSTHQLGNDQFSFGEARHITESFRTILEIEGYYDNMKRIGAKLHEDGYFGHVCVDSMQLKDGTIEPLVEINARKSMSLINYQMSERLKAWDLSCSIKHFNVVSDPDFRYADLLGKLSDAKLLFQGNENSGVIPLTSGTIRSTVAGDASIEAVKGKIILAFAYRQQEELEAMNAALKERLAESGLTLSV